MPDLTESQLAGLFDKSPDLVLIARSGVGGGLVPIAANRAYLSFAGIDPGSLDGLSVEEVRAWGEPALFEQKCRKALELRGPVHYEEHADLSGGVVVLVVSVVPLLQPGEEADYVVSTARIDATPSRAFESPRGAEQRLGSILDTTHEAYVGMDSYGLITDWNPAAEELLGWTRDEAVGRVLGHTLIPDRFREAHERGLQRYLATGEGPVLGIRMELYARHRSGSEFPVEITISPLRAGETVSFHAFMHDITERKRAESYLLAQHAVSRVLAAGAGVSETMPRLLAALGEALEWEFGSFWEPVDGELVPRVIWKAEGVELPQFEQMTRELRFAKGVGVPGTVWETGKPLWTANVVSDPNFPRAPAALEAGLHGGIGLPVSNEGEGLGVIEYFSARLREPDADLLEMLETLGHQIGNYMRRKSAEEELAAAAADLERSNEELEQFAYVASHDLSEPLRMVSGFVQLLQRRYKDGLDEEAEEIIGFALSGVDRMQGMITDLLAYSRAGRDELTREEVDTAALVDETRLLLKAPIDEADAEIVKGELPLVHADPGRLGQLFQNLISNAVKFHGPERPRVEVGAEPTDSGWVFTVADNGIGVPDEQREQIFKMFQRLHGREQYGGSGIGLAICKRIVERHGGELWVEGRPGGGSAFRFSLPD